MAKHLTKQEWLKWFKEFEKPKKFEEWNKFWESFAGICNVVDSRNVKARFNKNYSVWKKNNDNFSMKKENRGRPKKRTDNEREKVLDQLTPEELREVARRYLEIQDEKKNSEKNKEAKSLRIKRVYAISLILNITRQGIYKIQNRKSLKKVIPYEQVITEAFFENKRRYGRERLSVYLKQTYGLDINYRTLGRYMNALGLYCKVRKARRKGEVKNTNVKFKDLVKRNYNPKKDNIISTDVSYIPAKGSRDNHVYLSIAISHKTKKIENWNLGEINNNELVLSHIKKTKPRKDLIIHSDHGYQYSSNDMISLSKKMNFKISMGEVGNSLDNRESEYFFGCLKSEGIDVRQTRKMTFDQIKEKISDYIKWYNTKRIQKRLHWLTPEGYSQLQSNV